MADQQVLEQHNSSRSPSPSSDETVTDRPVRITVAFAGHTHAFDFDSAAVLDDLVDACEDFLPNGQEYDWDAAKFIAPKAGLLKARDKAEFPLAELNGKKVNLMVSKASAIDALRQAEANARRRAERRLAQRRNARSHQHQHQHQHHSHRHRDPQRAQDDATYTFMAVRPLSHLPRPERSQAFLQRLKEDPGIRSAMRKHRFSVGLLTEMDPLSYTEASHEGTTRVLGLNRNQGEVIELRLRTDAYDGYRDYRTIRKTLCHELAHNVHGPHDRNFWDLCHQIEREVDAGDWKHGGRTVGDQEYYEPVSGGAGDEEDIMDHGGWTGGSYVLGGSSTSAGSVTGASGQPLSRREIIAKAAEERRRRMDNARPDGGNDGDSRPA
ncbi:putative ubiquitin metalloprotease fusion protein [Phaeoacremonium minimum UCRPA7]|uniref:Putative ubiquitin metalloprotease fusion protein n=1 Tax=Phaeoacremonium minimum (strain UCR-PA7) TaxID=1286976 RepID=R8BJ39_PHAM7|nr:putative ubiquitin metalloprotease fusion protein [Phaeoacremonium minimum UCRPA7]EON99330.1 putative ubiquitin metalloprotease fusion protein [Phaeoacremonium minimum UCRPA7]